MWRPQNIFPFMYARRSTLKHFNHFAVCC